MLRAIRQYVTVGPGGVVRVQCPELPVGCQAEVIVLLEPIPDAIVPSDPASRLAALDKLQKELNLTPESAAKWAEDVRQERLASADRVLRRQERQDL